MFDTQIINFLFKVFRKQSHFSTQSKKNEIVLGEFFIFINLKPYS